MRKLSFFMFIVLLTTFITSCGPSQKAEWKERSKLKNLESMLIKSIKLLESKKYEEYVKLVKKPSFLAQLSSSEFEEFSRPIEENALAFIEGYKKMLKTEPRFLEYDSGKKPDDIDETVIFMIENNFVAFDKINNNWYHQ